MNDIVAQLRDSNALPLAAVAADLIESLRARIISHETLLDRCAATLAEAILTEDGIDSTRADECIDAIRARFGEVGKTTHEEMVQTLYDLIGNAAGLPANTEFDPKHILSEMRACITIQSKNGAYLEHLLPLVYSRAAGGEMRLLASTPGEATRYLTFPEGTQWPVALDIAMRGGQPASAGA